LRQHGSALNRSIPAHRAALPGLRRQQREASSLRKRSYLTYERSKSLHPAKISLEDKA
jgi:hypothetical protein